MMCFALNKLQLLCDHADFQIICWEHMKVSLSLSLMRVHPESLARLERLQDPRTDHLLITSATTAVRQYGMVLYRFIGIIAEGMDMMGYVRYSAKARVLTIN